MSLINFTDTTLAHKLLENINTIAQKLNSVTIMEVCGTHTMEIGRLSLRSLLSKNIKLVSGPGCPVCVTPGEIIDAAGMLARKKKVTVLSFGDMLRVPGNRTSLEDIQSKGGLIEAITSPLQAVKIAIKNPDINFIFIAAGFETTAPVVARSVILAYEKKVKNLSFLVSLRIIPPALDALISDKDLQISGFMLPGHVSAVIGLNAYKNLISRGKPAAVTGFEPLDIINGVYSIISMLAADRVDVVNSYTRVVREEGNPSALKLINDVFEPVDSLWRGIGMIPQSGLALREKYSSLDAMIRYSISIEAEKMPDGCACGDVLRGKIDPDKCKLFGKTCNPISPRGPCMVSTEGSCAAYFRYGGR